MAANTAASATSAARRQALARVSSVCANATVLANTGWLAACGGGGSSPEPAAQPAPPLVSTPPVTTPPVTGPAPPPAPPPAPANPSIQRLKAALANTTPVTPTQAIVSVSQAGSNQADSTIAPDALIFPPKLGYNVNNPLTDPMGVPVTAADLAQVWRYRSDTWTRQAVGYIGADPSDGGWYVPVDKQHHSVSYGTSAGSAFHFVLDAAAFEILIAGRDPQITLIADGRFVAPTAITTTITNGVVGPTLSVVNGFIKIDFGTKAVRHISLYCRTSQGLCAFAIAKEDSIQPWDRSAEPSFCAMTDSYGQKGAINWTSGGPFWEAAVLLGIPHLDINAEGGTGYAPNNGNAETRDPGNAFAARIPDSVTAAPDIFLSAGGINDNNSVAAPPLYATAADALAGFNKAVSDHFKALRQALPNTVLVGMGPWAPVASIPPDVVAQSKLTTIKAALAAIAPPWVLLDNLNGGWSNSSGASAPQTGTGWQTGTGNVGSPKGDGNGDLYVSADGTHPTPDGCLYLGQQIAINLRAGILAL